MKLGAKYLIATGAVALGLTSGTALVGHTVANAHSAATFSSKAPMWLVADAKKHTATLTVIAGYNSAMGGFNFDGYFKGGMVVTVPSGYKVTVVFSNSGALPHSALFTSFAKKDASQYTVAFKGATSPNPTVGIGKGITQKFTFTASTLGSYAFVCAVPGHEAAGMWDTFKVNKGGTASVTFKK